MGELLHQRASPRPTSTGVTMSTFTSGACTIVMSWITWRKELTFGWLECKWSAQRWQPPSLYLVQTYPGSEVHLVHERITWSF